MFSDLFAIKIKKDPPNTEGKNGGCGKTRTCDLYDVNVTL